MENNTTYTLGRVGMVMRGEFDPSATYEEMDVVPYSGNSYAAKMNTDGALPADTDKWLLIARGVTTPYSAPEADTGKRWIDGKKICQRIISGGPLSTGGHELDDYSYVDALVDVRGYLLRNDGCKFPVNYATTTTICTASAC